MSTKAPGVRLNQAILLLAGALFLVVVVAPDDSRFYWTPRQSGSPTSAPRSRAAATAATRATACALTGWGASVAVAGAVRPDLDVSGLYLIGAGLGMVAGLLLERAEVPVNPMGLAVTIMAGGLALALTAPAPGVFADARLYAGLIGAVAAANIALALAPRLQHTRAQPPATLSEHHTQDPKPRSRGHP